MKKKASIFLAIVLLFAMTAPAFAMPATVGGIIWDGGGVSAPDYVAITSIAASFSMSGSTANCSAAIRHTGARANVRLILQRSTDGGRTFSDFATLSNENFTTQTVAARASRSGVDTNFTYRTKVVVTIFDASGRQIDSGTAFS